MAKKNENDYYVMLSGMAECSVDASSKLLNILNEFNSGQLQKQLSELHDIEHKGDELKHRLTEKLAKEFITPIDREDFLRISNEIDDVIDLVEDVLIKIYMFNIQSIRPEAFEFASIVKRCCEELLVIMREFSNYKKSNTIHSSIVELNRLEELGDSLHIMSIRNLFTVENNAADNNVWMEVFNCFERCCDACEHAANLVEHVIMKNI